MTDANLVLGRIDPAYFLGGEVPLDLAAARRALQRRVAGPLGLSVEEAAAAVVRVVDANMTKAIGVKSVHKGHDLREFALAAFGGAGPLHAAALADDLAIPEVIVPVNPGAFSAFGLLTSDARHDYTRTLMKAQGEIGQDALRRALHELDREGQAELERQGFAPDRRLMLWSADLRFEGQSYELNVPIGPDADLDRLYADFAALHERVYSFKAVDERTLIVSLRVTALGRSGDVRLPEISREAGEPKAHRPVWFDGFVRTPVYERSRLGAGQSVEGPAVIEESHSVTVVPPGRRARADRYGNLRIRS